MSGSLRVFVLGLLLVAMLEEEIPGVAAEEEIMVELLPAPVHKI